MQGNLHGGAILLTQAGAFCSPQKGLYEEVEKSVEALEANSTFGSFITCLWSCYGTRGEHQEQSAV